MKALLFASALLFLPACTMNGAYHASGTLIGVEVGAPSVGSLSVGFRNFEVTAIGDKATADISMTAEAGTDGLDTTKRTIFNGPADKR